MKWGMRIWHCESECNVGKEVGARPQGEPANINTDPHNSISFPVLQYILFSPSFLSQRVRIHGRRHCDDREMWVWSELCDDTSETRPRQVLYTTYSTYSNPCKGYSNAFPQAKRHSSCIHHLVSTHKTSAPSRVDFLVHFALALSPHRPEPPLPSHASRK